MSESVYVYAYVNVYVCVVCGVCVCSMEKEVRCYKKLTCSTSMRICEYVRVSVRMIE